MAWDTVCREEFMCNRSWRLSREPDQSALLTDCNLRRSDSVGQLRLIALKAKFESSGVSGEGATIDLTL